jgi:hypothetical protein
MTVSRIRPCSVEPGCTTAINCRYLGRADRRSLALVLDAEPSWSDNGWTECATEHSEHPTGCDVCCKEAEGV